jgi:hypothetical protein
VRLRATPWVGAAALLLAAWGLVPALRAYTTGQVRSGDGAIRIAAVPGTPPGNPRPLVYCTADSVTVTAGSNEAMTVTCYNGLGYSVELSLAYTASPVDQTPPTYSPASPLSLTVPSNSSAGTSLTVQTTAETTQRTYTVTFQVTTGGSDPIRVTFELSGTATVQ